MNLKKRSIFYKKFCPPINQNYSFCKMYIGNGVHSTSIVYYQSETNKIKICSGFKSWIVCYCKYIKSETSSDKIIWF